MLLTDRQTRILATIGTLTAVSMYVSYIPQIQMNLAGHKAARCSRCVPPSTARSG